MKRLKYLIIMHIVLVILLLAVVIMYLVHKQGVMPHTEVYFTNTTIIGRIFG